jgi:hypothetical protein
MAFVRELDSIVAQRRRLKILILHQNSDLNQVRRTSFNHAFFLLKYAPWNEYELHSFGEPISPRLRREHFDAILIDTTFLCWRWALPHEKYIERILSDYAFIAQSNAIKIALPQDEYDETERLDDWLAVWRVDYIYSVCYEYRNIFYSKSSRYAHIIEGLTGFIDDADVAIMKRFARPFADRTKDVGYRARDLPPNFGRFSRLKAQIGEQFLGAAQGRGLQLDIAVGNTSQHALVGDDWLRFLVDCRFTLGCESGSSLLDPRGEIRAACNAYLEKHPDAGFDEVEAECFPNIDMKQIYSAISPRVFEAALAGNCQILVPGHYLGLLKPNEHYVPLAADFSNIESVLQELTDWPAAQRRALECRHVLLSEARLTYRGFTADLLQRITARLNAEATTQFISLPKDTIEITHDLVALVVRTAAVRSKDLEEALALGTANALPSTSRCGIRQTKRLLLRGFRGARIVFRATEEEWEAREARVKHYIGHAHTLLVHFSGCLLRLSHRLRRRLARLLRIVG